MSGIRYLWYQYRLQVACDKCGNQMVLQALTGSPECESCGAISRHTWLDAMDFCRVEELAKGKTGNKHLMGLMTATSSSEAVDDVRCHHCKKTIHPGVDIATVPDYRCEHCQEKISFQEIRSVDGLVLYRFSSDEKMNGESAALIAVRCVSCGAPMEVDARKTHYPCSFCKVENVLPPSLRQKRVLDDIFIGMRKEI